MAQHCAPKAEALTELLATDDGAEHFKSMIEMGDRPEIVAETIGAYTREPDQVMAEWAELPESFLPILLTAWELAHDRGVLFTVLSETPVSPITYARTGRVTTRIEYDAGGVRLYVSHVEGHHAEWFKPRVEAAV